MVTSNYPPPAELLNTPQDCRKYGVALESALSVLQGAGIRISQVARLRTAAKLLLHTAEVDTFPVGEAERRRVANAMSDASDFANIAALLPSERGRQILGELQQAMKGTLDDARQRRTPYRFQSQYWLGSVLSRGGYQPRVPTVTGSHPDFLVEEGTYQYGVEIKRPETSDSALKLLEVGASQLHAFGVQGLILFDLSECTGVEALSYVARGDAHQVRDKVIEQFRTVTRALSTLVLDQVNSRHSREFDRILGLISIARGWSWLSGEPAGLALFATAGATMFFTPVRDLRYHHSVNLLQRTIRGLRAAGYEFEEFRDVAAPPANARFSWEV